MSKIDQMHHAALAVLWRLTFGTSALSVFEVLDALRSSGRDPVLTQGLKRVLLSICNAGAARHQHAIVIDAAAITVFLHRVAEQPVDGRAFHYSPRSSTKGEPRWTLRDVPEAA